MTQKKLYSDALLDFSSRSHFTHFKKWNLIWEPKTGPNIHLAGSLDFLSWNNVQKGW